MSIKKFLKDKGGAAIIYVVVAAAIIILLGAATTTTAYVNLKATQVEKNSENNFYNADAIMNLITAGFERDMSVAYDAALTEYLARPEYNNMTADEQWERFSELFLSNLLDQGLTLEDSANRDFANVYYNLEHIQDYVRFSLATSAVNRDDLRYTITAVNGGNYIDKIDKGLILRNLHITYESDTGYFDEITTDVKITTPKPPHRYGDSFTTIMLFHEGIEVNSTKGAVVRGDAWVGADNKGNALLLQDSSSLEIMSPVEAALKGEIKTVQNNRLTLRSSNTGGSAEDWANKIYTENINIGKSAVVSILGRIYVLDDLEVNGSNSDVTMKGDYWGYSNGNTKASDSSAININGANTTMDITGLNSLTLAGASYIDVHVIDSGSYDKNTGELAMGEAFSVKSNQVAYLVDDKEFTTIGAPAYNKVRNFVSNPMSKAQYDNMTKNINKTWDDVQTAILNAPLSYNNKSYKDFGATAIKKVFRQDGTVHLYLEFKDPASAANFFTTVYKGNGLMSQRVRAYAAEYISLLEINSSSELYVNENYIDPSVMLYTEAKIFDDGFNYSKNTVDKNGMIALCNGLKEEYLGNKNTGIEGIKDKNTFDDIVDTALVKTFIAQATTAKTDSHTNTRITTIKQKDTTGVILQGSTDAKAIIIDNAESDTPYVIEGGSGVIICTGDLEIKGDWLGTILCGGRTYIIGGTKEVPINITYDTKTITDTLSLYYVTGKDDTDRKAHGVMQVLHDYKQYEVNDATKGEGTNDDRINTNLTFTNWDRQ